MFSRCIRRCTARRVHSHPGKFQHLFDRLGIPTQGWQDWSSLAPLLTQHFVLDDLKLYTFGDSIVQSIVYEVLGDYCLRHHSIASTNIVRCCGSAFYNPYTLRYIAEEQLG